MTAPDQLVAIDDECTSAEELLDKLAPHHVGWNGEPELWIYRGQSKDDPLLAKAHREERFFEAFHVDLSPVANESVRKARDRVESQLIRDFVRELHSAGIQVPPESLRTWGGGNIDDFVKPPDGVRALAQHYGIPTSFLDWSTQATKAGYFAAVGAAQKPDAEKLVIWALRRDAIERRMIDGDLRIVTPPQWTNPNQHAQGGTFTHFMMDELTPLDEYLPRVAVGQAYVKEKVPFPWMRKLTAPRSFGPKLLRLLAAQSINGTTMFPGHDGVVRAIKERGLWDRR